MPCRLLVILGAGASFDCASGNGGLLHEEWQPPLVTGLFQNRPSFTRILHHYPLAEQAAADIRPAINNSSVAIEAFLRDRLRDSDFEHHRRQYWAIPLYLQQLMFEICMWDYDTRRGYCEQPDSYDRLISAALMADQVTFVTLNYDDLFDRRLFIHLHGGLQSMDSYLADGRQWALIKLHGSINWGRLVLNPPTVVLQTDPVMAQTLASLGDQIELSDDIELRQHVDLQDVRVESVREMPPHLYYPALAAPLGNEDELVCPPEHVAYLKDVTGHWDPLDVLVIGYSGLDDEVLKLLSWGQRPVRSLSVVSDNEENAQQTASRIRAKVEIIPALDQPDISTFPDGFSNFAQTNQLDDYISRIRRVAVSEDQGSS